MSPDIPEQVDIIDANNNVIGQTFKHLAHQQGLLHRIIISEIINPDGQWLLVKQAGDRQDPGQYVSPVGGHVKAGESELDALAREAEEEAGIIDIGQPKRIGAAIFDRYVNNHQENHYFIVYQINVANDYRPVLNHESESCAWFTKEQITTEFSSYPNKFGSAFHFVWQKIYEN